MHIIDLVILLHINITFNIISIMYLTLDTLSIKLK